MLTHLRRSRASLAALVALAGALLPGGGCTSIDGVAADRTRLAGQVPSGLGRLLGVSIEGVDDAATVEDLLMALRTEFEGRDLFDRVEPATPDLEGRRRTCRLDLRLVSSRSGEVFDSWKISDGYVVRFDMAVALRDPDGRSVLTGTVTGVAVDEVSDLDALPPERRDDMRVAALYDAAGKLSRALRRSADDRARTAQADLTKITLPPGAGPVGIALIGFDDEEKARRLRGPHLVHHLAAALAQLGPDVAVLSRDEVARALDADPRARTSVHDMNQSRLDPIARECAARLFVVGRVVTAAGRARAEMRVLDRSGNEVFKHESSAEGLGALRVVAIELAQALGEALVKSPPG